MRTDIQATVARGSRWRSARALCLVLLVILLTLAHPASRAAANDAERATKAKFLYQLTRYVTWPEAAHETPDAPVVIGVVDDTLLADTLRSIVSGKKVRGRSVAIVAITGTEDPAVHLLFLPEAGRGSLRRRAHRHQEGTVLTVAEEFDFPELGGDVGIEFIDGRISFSINRRKVTRGDFSISSKLMRLASEVQ